MVAKTQRTKRLAPVRARGARRRRQTPIRRIGKDLTLAWLISPGQGSRIFDRAARREFKMSGEEFLRRLDAGEFQPIIDHPDHHFRIMRVISLLPLVRKKMPGDGR